MIEMTWERGRETSAGGVLVGGAGFTVLALLMLVFAVGIIDDSGMAVLVWLVSVSYSLQVYPDVPRPENGRPTLPP